MSVSSGRNITMDALKGIAILLVVVGHAIEGLPDFDANPVFRLIYAVHMPLFMFISGYLAYSGRHRPAFGLLNKKIAALVIPFVAWYALSYVINGSYVIMGLHDYFLRVIASPDWGLWFLWVLFLNFIGLAAALKLERWLKVFAVPAVWLVLQLQPINTYGFSLWRWHFTFFAVGFLVCRYAPRLQALKYPYGAAALVLFPIFALFWHRTCPPSFHDALINEFASIHATRLLDATFELYRYAVPLLGIAALWFVAAKLLRGWMVRPLAWFGTYTLDIYVTHQYLIRYHFGSGLLMIVSSAVIALAGSLAISFLILRRNQITAHILLGQPYRARKPKDMPAALTPTAPIPTPLAA